MDTIKAEKIMTKEEIRPLIKNRNFAYALIGIHKKHDYGKIVIFHRDKASPTGIRRVGDGSYDEVYDLLFEEDVPVEKVQDYSSFIEKYKKNGGVFK